jgi:2-polyprenyl-3-methyl-5-hydroxy-6-metoxy-1,4-benzoquinol methylase
MEKIPASVVTEYVHCNLCGCDDVENLIRFNSNSVLSKTAIGIDLSGVPEYPAIVKCKNCGLTYVNPRWKFAGGVMPYTEEAEEAYFSDTLEKRKFAFDDLIVYTRAKFQFADLRILDVGCGDGLILKECDRFGVQCDGFEISESLVRKLQNQFGKERILTGSLDTILEKTYNVVYLINVIEHLPNPLFTLKQIYRILKPGGVVFIHAPNFGGLPARLLGARWHQVEPLGHLYYFNNRTLRALLQKTGFQVEDNFYLKSNSVLKRDIQRILYLAHVYADNGLGVMARRPFKE